jgi:uncharacterized protein (DUF433 family)
MFRSFGTDDMTGSSLPGEVYPGIVVDPAIAHGVPVIAGTRIPARIIVGHLAGGETIDAVMDAYTLSDEQVRAALGYAAERLATETVYVLLGA